MNKAEFIKGINMAIEGLTAMRDAVENEGAEKNTATPTAPATKTAVGGKKAPVSKAPKKAEATQEAPTTDGQTYTTAELTGMKYNEFKKLASSLGVDCKGTRDEIMARVVALGVVTDAEESAEEAPVEKKESKPVAGKSNKSASVGKGGLKKADAPTTDEFHAQAEVIAKETSVADIIDALKGVGVKATKLDYKKKLAGALRDGLIAVGEEEAEAGEAEAESDGEEVSAETYFGNYDVYEVNDPDKMGEARATACAEKQGAILEAVAEGNITSDDIIDFLQNNATQEELDLLGEEYTEDDLIQLYIEVSKHFIDEDGEEHEPGEAYMIGEDAFCCGMPLAYDEATGKFLCSHCAGEYDAE